jgi:hypothetical protein
MDTTRLQRLSSTVSRQDPEPDQYLTDGRKLFRVVVLRVFNDEELVELEDCATLDVWLVSPDEVRCLRRVRRSRPGGVTAVGMGSPSLGHW